MAAASTANRPTPERIFTIMNAFQQTEALKTGIELDVFSAIGAGADTPPLLAAKTGASERGLRILCDFLTIMGVLAKENGRETLMRRVHASLKHGGKAVTLEFVPNEDRVTPPGAAAFSLNMLVGTDAGDAYTFSEYEKMFRNMGFAMTRLHSVPGTPQRVMISEKTA
ncbi:MAG: methyltransferase [Candidatus Acidiferrum sp.]